MSSSTNQLVQAKALEGYCNDWLSNYFKFGLSAEPECAAQYPQIIATLSKASLAIRKLEAENIPEAEQGSVPVSKAATQKRAEKKVKQQEKKAAVKDVNKELKEAKKAAKKSGEDTQTLEEALNSWKDLAVDWIDSGIGSVLDAKGKLDKGLIAPAEDIIAKAESFISIASLFTGGELGDKVDKVQEWLDGAKKVIEKVNAVDVYLKQWRDVAVGWMESGISDVVSAGNVVSNVTNGVVKEASDFKNLVKNFIDGAKDVGDAALDEKIQKAKDWLKDTDAILDKAGDMLDNLFEDADKNELPDWYDVLSNEWDEIALKDLIPGTNIDNAILDRINSFKGKVDDFVKKATTEYSPAVKEKIDEAKAWLHKIDQFLTIAQEGQQFVEDLRNGDFNAVYDKLKAMWDGVDSFEDPLAGTDIDDKVLDKIKELKGKAESFAKMANSLVKKFPGGEKVGDVEDWIKKAMDIATKMAKGEATISDYLDLAKQWGEGKIKEIIAKKDELTADAAGQLSGFVNEVKKFIADASSLKEGDFADKIAAAGDWIKSSEGILDEASELIGLVLGDEDGNNLPDWYDKLEAAWSNVTDGKDLIPGMDFDDALIGKLNIFKGEAEKWLEKATGVGGDLQEKINTVKQWVESTGNFLGEVAGFIDDIKEGDMLSIYEKLKEGWSAIGEGQDLLEGTEVDNRLMDKAKDLKDKAESWLANALTGGKAEGEMTDDVKNILGAVDDVLTFLFTKYEVENHMQDFQEDKIVIDFPNARQLSEEEIENLLGEFSGGLDANMRNTLVQILTRINQEIINLGNGIDTAYRKTLNSGGGAAEVYVKAKGDYDSVMKKQKQVMKIIESVRKIVVGVITAALIPVNPAIAAAVGTLLSGTISGFGELAGLLGKTASEVDSGGTVGQIGGIISSVLPTGGGSSQMSDAENAGLINLLQLYKQGVTDKYEYVKEHVAKIQVELDKIYKNLYKQSDEGIENAKGAIATSADQFKRLRVQIEKKYINAKEARINRKAAYWLLSRAQYATWLSGKKDTTIVNEVIEALHRFKVMKEAGVKKWNKGFGGKLARGLGSFFGGWASFGYDKKVKKLRNWGKGEVKRLKDPGVWKRAFA